MRYAIYQNFYETLNKFVEDEKFVIDYEIFGEKYVLAFNKKEKEFYFSAGCRRFPKIKDTYSIIKSYVEKQIVEKQKKAFNGTFEKVQNFKLVFSTEENKQLFIELLKRFKEFLWEEPLLVCDIKFHDILRNISYGFSDSNVSWVFFQDIIEIMQKFPKTFETGVISYYMLPLLLLDGRDYKKEVEIEKLVQEGYVIIKKYQNTINIDIALTEKFYEALKKAFFYDFDNPVSVNSIVRFETA